MKNKQGDCTICLNYCTALNWHHTIPQALGGKNSLQIPLCPTCHDTLHANGDAVAARIKNGKPINRVFWKTALETENAKPYLEILVKAILNPPVQPENKTTKVIVDLQENMHTGLKCLKIDLAHKGITTLEGAAQYCIATVLHKRGLLNGNSETEKVKSKNANGNRADLW